MTTLTSSSHYALRTPANAAPLQTSVDQTIIRHRREATAEPVPVPESGSSRETGDKALAALYGHALLKSIEGSHDEVLVENVPPHSTFGQWWAQLGRAMESPWVKDWLVKQNADMNSVKISPESGEISFKLKSRTASDRRIEIYGPSDARWADVGRFVKDAGSVASSNFPFSFQPPLSEDSSSAPLWLVRKFYGESNLSDDDARTRAQALIRDNTFVERPSDLTAHLDEARGEDNLGEKKAALADNNTRANVVNSLRGLISTVTKDPKTSDQILDLLKTTRFRVEPDSTYPQALLDANNTTSLEDYIAEKDWNIPKTLPELRNLKTAILSPAPQPARYGNYGGALASPIPLSDINQQKLRAILHSKADTGDAKSVLDYLVKGRVFEGLALHRPPRVILDELIQSPRGKALGEEIKAKFDAMSVEGSAEDWLLAALSLFNSHPTFPMSGRDTIPRSRLITGDSFGQPARVIISRLADSLVSGGATTSPLTARIHAHLVLSFQAPEYLVKDIPDSVTVGSLNWVNLVTAVKRLEAAAPGSTASMTYAEVMARDDIDPISDDDRYIEYQARDGALKVWGLANGHLTGSSPATGEQLSEQFESQMNELREASFAQGMEMPLGKDLALEQLKKALPTMKAELFEKKCITLEPSIANFPGPYSVLDLYQRGSTKFSPQPAQGQNVGTLGTASPRLVTSVLVSSSLEVEISKLLPTINTLPYAPGLFAEKFSEYCDATKKSIEVQVKNLIANQPMAVRQDFSIGRLTVMREEEQEWRGLQDGRLPPQRGTIPSVHKLPKKNNNLLVKLELSDSTPIYEIDLKAGVVREREDLKGVSPGGFPKSATYPTRNYVEVQPDDADWPGPKHHERSGGHVPKSYSQDKTSYIAGAFIKECEFPSLKAEAKGATTFETEFALARKVASFFITMIPLRSAILNFHEGNIGAGFVDLAFDAFGFAVGLGAAALGSKALVTGASVGTKALHYGKILGRAGVGVLNPFDGLGDLGVSLVSKGAGSTVRGVRSLRGASGTYDVVKASKKHTSASIGTFKSGSEVIETAAVLKNGKWHAYNNITQQPYGPALKDFLPSVSMDPPRLEKWMTASDPVKGIDPAIRQQWKSVVSSHRNGPNKADFENGYNIENLGRSKGLTPSTKIEDLMKMAGNDSLTAAQVGGLVKRYDDIAYEFGRAGNARFINSVEPRFGIVTPIPQVIYLSKTAQLSEGQCAALSRTMATAMASGQEHVLIRNMYTAAAFPSDSASRTFANNLYRIQNQIGSPTPFHAGMPVRQISYQNMVKELGDSAVSKSLMIDSPGHAMAAGVKVEGAEKTFYFYDPNYGLAQFKSAESMEGGLKKIFHDKKIGGRYKTHSADRNKLEFKVSEHNDNWRTTNNVFDGNFKPLYESPFTPSLTTRKLSNAELNRNLEIFHANPQHQGLASSGASMLAGQAEGKFVPEVFDTVMDAINRQGGSNYSAQYQSLMGIEPSNTKTLFNPADITESGLIHFKSGHVGGAFAHTTYVQKTRNNDLFIFNADNAALDQAMVRSGITPQVVGGMSVYRISNGSHRGLQSFLDGADGKDSFQFSYTPASTLNANVQKLKA